MRALGEALFPSAIFTDLLVGQDIAANLPLSTLNQFDIRLHTFRLEARREKLVDIRIRVETSELNIPSAVSWFR